MIDLLASPSSVLCAKATVSADGSPHSFVKRVSILLIVAGFSTAAMATPPRAPAPTVTLTISDAFGNVTDEVGQGEIAILSVVSSSSRAAQMRFCEDVVPCYGPHIVGTVEVTTGGTATLRFRPHGGAHTYTAVSMATNAQASGQSATSALRVAAQSATTLSVSGTVGNQTLTSTTQGYYGPVPAGSTSFFDFGPSGGPLTASFLGLVPLVAGAETVSVPGAYDAGPVPAGTVFGTGDFNNDGVADVILLNPASPGTVLLGGAGASLTPVTTTIAAGGSIVTGDFNRDGNLDIAIAGGSAIYIQFGNGDGTFQAPVAYPVSGGSQLAGADFNGDGNQDLIATGGTANTFNVLLGSGTGTFTVSTSTYDFSGANTLLPMDYDKDGNVDLVVAGQNNGSSSIAGYKGNGDGTFSATSQFSSVFASPSISVVSGDLKDRGLQDLVVTLSTGDDPTSGTFSSIISLGTGDGNGFAFGSIHALDTGTTGIHVTALADLDGDGFFDLVYSGEATGGGVAGLSLGTGTGDFKTDLATPETGITTFGIAPVELGGNPAVVYYPTGGTDLAVVAPLFVQNVTSILTGVNLIGTGDQQIVSVFPGNESYLPSLGGPIDVAGQPAMMTLSASPGSSDLHQQVALIAMQNFWNGNGNSTNGETVSFYSGGTLLGSANLVSGQAILNTTSLPVGVNQLTAVYAGDANFSAITSPPLAFTVQVGTSLGVTCSGGATYGATYGCNVRVLGTAGIPTGSVSYTFDGGSPVTVPLTAGLASFYIPMPTLGSHTVVVSYAGQDSFAGVASQTRTFTVAPAVVNMGVTCSGGTPFGTAYNCNLRLLPQLPASGIPTGSISYTVDGGAPISVSTQAGLASFSIPPATLGSHTVFVSYAGDGNFAGVPTQNESFTVTPAAVDMGITCSGGATYGSTFGCNVRLLSKAGIPPGSISYTLDGGAPASVVTNAGLASFYINSASLGGHTVVISYAGQGNYNGVPSQSTTFTVAAAPVSLGVTCSGGATYGSTFACNTRLLAQLQAAGIPTGSISYTLDGGAPVSVATNAALASFTIATASLGSHTVVVSYAGQGNYAGVASQTETFMVTPAPVSLGVTCSGGTTVGSVFGCNMRLLSLIPAAGIPTGRISYAIDGREPVSLLTNSGLASFYFTTPGVGSHTVVIAYPGNGNYAGVPSQNVSFTTVP